MPDNLTDPSRSTEQFRAFVRKDAGEPAKAGSRNRILLIAGIVVAVVVIVAIVAAVA
ncbi:MAG TPA: hypothetical protein VGH27_26945 [Streptosporangiaceae bacterium]|jgi:hypothetical protein